MPERTTRPKNAAELVSDEEIPASPPSDPEDLFWLSQGQKMLADSIALTPMRAAASSLMTGLGALQAVYMGILGFSKFVPEDLNIKVKWFFIAPPILWMLGLYHCLKALKSERVTINLKSPNEIRKTSIQFALDKQTAVDHAFSWMLAGVVAAIVLLVFRLKI